MATVEGSATADTTTSVQDFIALRNSDDITYYNYSILEYHNGFDMFITNLLYDYQDELDEMTQVVELTPLERAKYRYKPYLFAFDLYGSTESKFIIMMLNGIIDPKEFDFDKVKVLRYSDLITILNRMDAVNEDYINTNRSKLKEDFKNNDGNTVWG